MIGTSHGAISVINAIPCGVGSTIGISLKTQAEFVTGVKETRVRILDHPGMDDTLARLCVSRTLERISADDDVEYELTIKTQIPPSRGLKSSSSVCNAIVSSVVGAYGVRMDEMEMLRIGVDCAREAEVTITGAFDDVCGCHFGGVVFTDNSNNELLERRPIQEYDVLLWIPEMTIPKNSVSVDAYKARKKEFDDALALAYEDPLAALTLNGRLVAEIIGADTSIVDLALSNGALAAGISGTGPAISVVCKKGDGDRISTVIGGKVIRAVTR